MDWLNYHHLRYFLAVAQSGSLRAAAEKLHVSPPSISAQIRELEATLGEKLFRRSGRANVLTDAGQIALRHAEEIFSLGQELVSAVKQRPTMRALRLNVGVADAFPKLVTYEILQPLLVQPEPVHLVCREGKLEDLLPQLAAHRLDVVLSDEPAPSTAKLRVFNHQLGESGITFCAAAPSAAKLRKGFPRSLHEAPAFLPAENTALRRSLENWFRSLQIRPRVVAEFDDAALMKVAASRGLGFVPIPTVVVEEAVSRYRLQRIGMTERVRDEFHAITAERRITHPLISLITSRAQERTFA
jgi:LysR family transcriptional activator of nhaA